ncbi:ABC-type enterochelin transport system, periplasmic component [Rubellimicrobium thermophilum DSM 16684]|uniref:ABC-type enterochelin transport system, periplasmic component n=1 Tax=Rubellimicrobium thermophilum DSM 16684 TaxID=1123069 RepID=S9R748_9RHOB|nr:siderophore ABC transporter substrate-binding protein [Rubellimicrobium thermophilum]EPX87813.1 ABC-type enterochelin transport system, periplasmic component [Rubellimicrobium thermophilum DSM 16684]
MLHHLGRAAAFLILTSLPAWAEDVTITTARGEVTLPANPATLAVMDIAAIDTLAALGVVPQGVPDKLYVPYLADRAGEATVIGTLFEPDLEALAGLDPDLIIAGGRSASQVEALSQVAPTIDMTIWEDVVGQGRDRIAAYGTLFGKEEQAAQLIAALDAKLAETAAAVAGKGNALILQTNGPKISAYGAGSRFGWIHTALGLPEAHENLNPETHGDSVSFEFIAEVNPDWLIVIDRAAAIGEPASAADTLDNPLVAGTTAGQKGQIVYLSPAPIYIAGGGYTSMMTTLDELLAAFSR